ncbi:Nramp family divalent metal transporter [Paraburkholderia sp. J76]|uniref:Nramp family divalent metal transporter n=1 Tax=Paraburkholderia sp. J76 TaxID=2805439 RepID=UPI002ABE134D|nr:Nramp family divalent metal transporter [Paraburkholderia sp. J76]
MNRPAPVTFVSPSLSEQARETMRAALAGTRRGPRAMLAFAGPAVVASIAYMDPGNFATNIQAGAGYGYSLLWVVVVANVAAMLFQSLSAKLGIVTGRNLAELCRVSLPRRCVFAMWAVSEAAAMATDLAEFTGGALGVSLLFHIGLAPAMVVTGVVTWGLLQLETRGFRPLECFIAALVGIMGFAWFAELVVTPVSWRAVALHSVTPALPDANALTLAVGIVGATVMPHALFLHSGLMPGRVAASTQRERRKLLAFSNLEVIAALGLAGAVNIAMVVMASGAFHRGHATIASIDSAWQALTPLLGSAAAGLFLTALLASGVSSSVVGTMAGQMIMQGFLGWRIPVAVRRLVTMAPAFGFAMMGVDTMRTLVMSQVVLSLALPLPMIALVWFTSRGAVMGPFRNRPPTILLAVLCTAVVLALNIVLLLQAANVTLFR